MWIQRPTNVLLPLNFGFYLQSTASFKKSQQLSIEILVLEFFIFQVSLECQKSLKRSILLSSWVTTLLGFRSVVFMVLFFILTRSWFSIFFGGVSLDFICTPLFLTTSASQVLLKHSLHEGNVVADFLEKELKEQEMHVL